MYPTVNYINCNNLFEQYRMTYYTWGQQDTSNKTLICLHGLNRNGRDWDYLAQHLVKLGYFIIAPDIVGRGNSGYLLNPLGYDFPYYVTDVFRLINVLALQNISVLGTSMGGIIGMAMATTPMNTIKKLILNDIGAEIEISGLMNIANYSGLNPSFGNFQEASDYVINNSLEFGDLPDYIWEHIAIHSVQKNQFGLFELKRDFRILNPILLQSFSNSSNVQLWSYWNNINIPVLVIRGESSTLLSKTTLQKMQKENMQSIEIAKAGHAPFLYLQEHGAFINEFLES